MKNLFHFFVVVMIGLLLPLSLSAQTIDELKTRAANGDAAAQHDLGLCYYNGEGVTKDYAEAVRWWRKAAEQGVAAAQNNLGVCYDNGEGVTKDDAEAVRWYRKAAEQGDAKAKIKLNDMGMVW